MAIKAKILYKYANGFPVYKSFQLYHQEIYIQIQNQDKYYSIIFRQNA